MGPGLLPPVAPESRVAQQPVHGAPTSPTLEPVWGTVSFPLFSVQSSLSEDEIRAQGEKGKLALFGLVGKRTILGPKPETFIVMESFAWVDRVYVRVHGVYSATYVVDRVFPLAVGEDTAEVEVEGSSKLTAERGNLNLRARLRKLSRGEAVSYYDARAEEVGIKLPPRSQLRPLRSVHPPLTVGGVQEVLDAALDWAEKGLRARMAGSLAEGAVVERESIDVSDHEVILAPYAVLTYLNTKSGERRSLTYDSLTNTLVPSTASPVQPRSS